MFSYQYQYGKSHDRDIKGHGYRSPQKSHAYSGNTKEKDYFSNIENSWRQPNSYQAGRNTSDDHPTLRQTFDSRNNARIQAKILECSTDEDITDKAQSLRHTFQVKRSPLSIDDYDSSVKSQDRGFEDDGINISLPVKRKSERYGEKLKSEKQMDLDLKFKKYMSTIEKFKDQVKTNDKMSEELKRLREDRKKRLEIKDRQLAELLSFQKESPTYEKKLFEKKTSKLESNPTSSYSSNYHKNIENHKPVSNIRTSKTCIEDFSLGKNLGEGKFGIVYQAIHKKTGLLFALKKIPKEMIQSHLMVDQFILELKLQTYLSHSNILSIYTHFDDQTSIYLVLQYMEEGTLFSQLKKNKKIPQKEVSPKIREIASAVKYLHENQIAHRDIKPQNIVMSHGVCKLCDFGWATICEDRRKTYCGTFDYAPPEILQGVEYDYTVDLWCLGVLTYQLLVGKAPFYHISRQQTKKRILNVETTKIQYPKFLSIHAISFIENLLRKNPNERMNSENILDHPFLSIQEKISLI